MTLNWTGTAPKRVRVGIAAGQSNMAGYGLPTSQTLDRPHPRILQYGAKVRTLRPATEPLDMPVNNITGNGPTGLGPALQFARHMIADLPDDEIIVLIPTAVGSSALVGTGVNDWQWGGAPGNLSADAVVQTREALDELAIQFPEADIEVSFILWQQGERDGTNNVTMQKYLDTLGALIAGFRSEFGDVPFLVGQMAPAALASGTRRAVNEALSRAPYTYKGVGFVASPKGLDDGIHFTGPGQRKLGKEYYRVYKRVIGGLAPDNPIMPVDGVAPSNQDDWIIQTGIEPFPGGSATGINVVIEFPKPFGGIPFVIAQSHLDGSGRVVQAYAAGETKTQFNLRARADTTGGSGQTIKWIAYGPKYEG